MNSATIIGNLTRDPEVKQTSTGKLVANFSVAVKREHTEGSDFIDCVAWNQTADQVGQFGKGDKVFVSGSLKLDSWDDKETGKKRTKLSLVAAIVASQPKSDNVPEKPRAAHSPKTAMVNDSAKVVTEDDIPF